MIEDNYAICPVCGRRYTFTNARTDRCPVCRPVDDPVDDKSDDYDLIDEVYDDDD